MTRNTEIVPFLFTIFPNSLTFKPVTSQGIPEDHSGKISGEIQDVSDTALWVAAYRAQESSRPDALFRDPVAERLLGARAHEIAKNLSGAGMMGWVMAIRTIAIDRLIQQALDEGTQLILNLGAGLDTRPYRMKLPAELCWIEVDFPHMIEFKNSKLADASACCRLERTAVDLSDAGARRDLFRGIEARGLKVAAITEGVIPYLTAEQAGELAQDLAATPSIRYWIQDFYDTGGRTPAPPAWRKKLKAAPFRFSVPSWFRFFERFGWVPHRKIGIAEEAKRVSRRPPLTFVSLAWMLLPRPIRDRLGMRMGYVLLKRTSLALVAGTALLTSVVFPQKNAHAVDTLPYSTRTRAYSGWNTSVNGDVRTVGMAGSTIGLPDTFLSSTDNPAGLSMLLVDANDNLVTNNISDGHVQNPNSAIQTSSFGIALNLYPWGFSAGSITTSGEGQSYALPALGGQLADLNVSSREYRFGLSRVFWRDQIALGASFNVGVAEEKINPGPVAQDSVLGATFGALVRFPRHWLAGVSYSVPMHYGFSNAAANAASPQLPGFFQPLTSPLRLGVGAGWVPNRFFRFGASLILVGTTLTTSLLQNDSTVIGKDITLQPRLGGAYTFAEYKEFKGVVYAGSYLEVTRIDHTGSRVHLTSGVELHPWILTFGVGADFSAGYNNFLAGFGVDVFKALVKLDIVPAPYTPPYPGLLPSPKHLSDDGLPRTLVKNWKRKGPDINPFKVIREAPLRAEKKYEELKKFLEPPPEPSPVPGAPGSDDM